MNSEHNKQGSSLFGSFLLLITALIWGTAFVAQSVGMDYVGPCTFNGVRMFIGCVVLIPASVISSKRNKRKYPELAAEKDFFKRNRDLIKGGIACGVVITAAGLLQQAGLVTVPAGKSGFLTALYIVLVPVFGLFLGKRPGVKIWFAVAAAMVGTWLLSFTSGLPVGMGDVLIILSAVMYAVHILVIDNVPAHVDGVSLSCIQFFIAGTVSLIFAFILEKPDLRDVFRGWFPILYTGVLSCGIAYTLQIIGQKTVKPTVASLIMSLESVIAAISGWIILKQPLSLREIIGCVLVFGAVICTQLPEKRDKNISSERNQQNEDH